MVTVTYMLIAVLALCLVMATQLIIRGVSLDQEAQTVDKANDQVEWWLRFRYGFDDYDIRWFNSRQYYNVGYYPNQPPPLMPMSVRQRVHDAKYGAPGAGQSRLLDSDNYDRTIPAKYRKFVRYDAL